MIKKLIVALYFFSVACFAFSPIQKAFDLNQVVQASNDCGQALPTSATDFCPSFKAVAQCHCTSSGLPAGMCQDMGLLYSRMISMFGTIQHACEYQHDTSVQNCVNDWKCYREGGSDATGAVCSSTGSACG